MLASNELEIVNFIIDHPQCSSKEIHESISISISYATVKRIVSKLTKDNLLTIEGNGKSTRYSTSPAYKLLQSINSDEYYKKEIDERTIIENFNFQLIQDTLSKVNVFTDVELEKLMVLQNKHNHNISLLSELEFTKELERLAIDLSWKSSQIEGNTYTLLETERLIRERETASGKTKEEATMLLNHKDAIDFIIANPDYLEPLTISKIEDIHSILTKELKIDKNIRKRRVGISGTNYKPLDNKFQILEALKETCELVNSKHNVFERAILILVLISYIQPFVDGNKRTARIVSNAILMNNRYCPLSFRTVDSIDYKKAMLLFYEQNNIAKLKEIFIDQFEFAVKTYF
jgi:predicted transcriptional regulator